MHEKLHIWHTIFDVCYTESYIEVKFSLITQKARDNQTYELPFPGPCLQMARIWMISSMVLNLFGGLIIWILFIKEHVRWIYTATEFKIKKFI